MAKQWHQLERLDHKALKKLQLEREKAAKLAAQKEENRKRMIVGGTIGLIVLAVFCLLLLINKKAKDKAFIEARNLLCFSEVTEFTGTADTRLKGTWARLNTNLKFNEDRSFKTDSESSVSIKLQLDNIVKICANSEARIKIPEFESPTDNKIKSESVEFINGEITVSVNSLEAKDILSIYTSNIVIKGKSGLFKIIYNEDNDKGEIIVKNGLVEVTPKNSKDKPIKVTGFFKVLFDNGEITSPTQASVIQYDWTI